MEDLSRTVHHLQLEIRALREGLERTARHAHDVDPSTGHLAEFDRCPHPLCRQARALLLESPQAPALAPEEPRPARTPERRPPDDDLSTDDQVVLDEGMGGGEAIDGSGEDDGPSFIPLDRPQPPPPRKPATEPAARPAPAAAPKPAATAPAEAPPGPTRPRSPIVTPPPRTTPPPAARPAAASTTEPAAKEPALPPRVEPPSQRAEEPPIPSHLFDQPPRGDRQPPLSRATDPSREPGARPPQPPARPEERRPQEPPQGDRRPHEATRPPERRPSPGATELPRASRPNETTRPKPPEPSRGTDRPSETSRPAEREAGAVTGPARDGLPRVPSGPKPDDERDPNIADAAADAIDRLARALFGPKRPRR